MQRILIIISLIFLTACTTTPPKHPDNICQIFDEKDDWYEAAVSTEKHWGVPIPVQMAIIYQESSFVATAEPPRPLILGFIPWFRSSSAYGYPQAQDGTWKEYQQKTGHWFADRDDFSDSCDFIGWYCAVSNKKLGLSKTDTHNLYLAYHEGHGGFQRNSHSHKQWLLTTAQKVQNRARRYESQLAACRPKLEAKN
jgi:hypothetical protein